MNRSEAGKLGAEKTRSITAARHKVFVESYYKQPKKCKYCGGVIAFEKRANDFCGHTCSATFNNFKRGQNLKDKLCSCKFCNKMTVSPNYCSSKCRNEHKYKLFVEAWFAGQKDGCSGLGVSCHIRRWAREKSGNKCELCGWCCTNPVTGRVPLQIDHKDGNAVNNKPDNIRFICPNCHSLTPTFGNLNKGKGRKMRYAPKM
jgi:hypothetical protein